MSYTGLVQAPGRYQLCAGLFASLDFSGNAPCEVQNTVIFEAAIAILGQGAAPEPASALDPGGPIR
jgi:hypothetical protein